MWVRHKTDRCVNPLKHKLVLHNVSHHSPKSRGDTKQNVRETTGVSQFSKQADASSTLSRPIANLVCTSHDSRIEEHKTACDTDHCHPH